MSARIRGSLFLEWEILGGGNKTRRELSRKDVFSPVPVLFVTARNGWETSVRLWYTPALKLYLSGCFNEIKMKL
jgi:hypothetical protein